MTADGLQLKKNCNICLLFLLQAKPYKCESSKFLSKKDVKEMLIVIKIGDEMY